jgi:hypothetical protein
VLYQGRIPTEAEEKLLDYEMGVFLEHSMSPSAAGAIGVSAGRPNLPCAIAAAVSTFGGVHGPGAAHGYMLNKYLERAQREGKTPEEMAKILVDEYMDAGTPVMGMGQPQHIDSDPRAEPIHVKQEGWSSRVTPVGARSAFPQRRKQGPLAWAWCGRLRHGPHRIGFPPWRLVPGRCLPRLELPAPPCST